MATTPAVLQQYPLSTENGDDIPLDIIRPLAVVKTVVPLSGVGSVEIPEDWQAATFFCKGGCYVQFNAASIPNPLVAGSVYSNTLWVPPSTLTTSTVLPGDASIVIADGETEASILVVQQIQKWASLALNRQITKR